MYLVILESGEIFKSEEFTEDLKGQSDDGYLTIVDISNPEYPLFYIEEGWTDISIPPWP